MVETPERKSRGRVDTASRSRADHYLDFEVHDDGETTADVLIAGFSEFGLAGMTAADYLVDQLDLEAQGHVTTPDLPTITPFADGTPRHPIRLFTSEDVPVAVLMSEILIPPSATLSLSEALLDWTVEADIGEIAVLSGVPISHNEADHRTFYVATEDYQKARLADADVPPMGQGFTDGVRASLLSQGMDSSLRVCVYVTPAHAQAPDVGAALRLLETVDDVYDLDLDVSPLEAFAADVERYYAELADHMKTAADESDAYPADRMYM